MRDILESDEELDQQSNEIFESSENNFAVTKTVCLLANDNQFLLMAFQATLAQHFDEVETVENGQEAVDAVK